MPVGIANSALPDGKHFAHEQNMSGYTVNGSFAEFAIGACGL